MLEKERTKILESFEVEQLNIEEKQQGSCACVPVWSKLGRMGAAPAQCPLACLSATSDLLLKMFNIFVQEPLNPFLRKVWPMWERSEVQRLAGETHGEQIDTSRPSDSSMSRIMGRVHQIKNNPSDRDSSQHLLLLWLSLMNCDAWLDIYFLLFFLRFYQKPKFFSQHDI